MKQNLSNTISQAIKRLRRTRRSVAVVSVLFLIVVVPTVIYFLQQAENVEAGWWQGSWTQRKRLTLENTSSDSLASGTTVAVTVNTKALYESGDLQSDCDDMRVVYQPNESTETELAIEVVFPNNSTCELSTSTRVHFPLQAALGSGGETRDYYLYYGNDGASAPTSGVDVFDVGSTNALLVCPFRGDSTCVNADGDEAPTTESGAVRYEGLKSGLNFDGVNDYVSAADSSSLSVTGDLTVEVWFKMRQTGAEQTLVGKWDETTANDDRSYRLYVTSGDKLAFAVSSDGTSGNTTTITGGTTLSKDAWYHAAGVYDASAQTIDLYLDGTSDATQVGSAGTSIDDNVSNLYLGAKENTSGAQDTFFLGLLDEVRISSTRRYTGDFTPREQPHEVDFFTEALYAMDAAGGDPRVSNNLADLSGNDNSGTITGAVYVSGLAGREGPSEFGTHTGDDNKSVLSDSDASWEEDEWVGYVLFNETDASHGTVTANTTHTITATLAGGSENDWDNGDSYTLSPDFGRLHSGSSLSHDGVFIEEGTTNLIDNPSFENTTYDTSWTEGSGGGVVTAVVRTTAKTTTGSQTITTSDLGGNTPKAVWVIANYATSNGTVRAGNSFSVGAATGSTNEWYIAYKSDDNDGTDDTDSDSGTDATLCLTTPGNPGVSCGNGKADFTGFTTNGVELNWSTAGSEEYLITYIFFAGSDVSAHANNASLGNTTDGDTDITAPGFEPDLVMAGSSGPASPALNGGFGVAHNGASVTQRGYIWRNGGGVGAAGVYPMDGGVVGQLNGGMGLDWYGEINTFDTSGFTVTSRSGGANNNTFYYLALDLGTSVSSWVGTHTTPTSTGNDSETGPSFTPQLVYNVLGYGETIDTAAADANAGTWGFSAFDATNEYSNGFTYQQGGASTNTAVVSDDTAYRILDHDSTDGIEGSLVSMDANGWTTNYTNVEGAGKLFFPMAIASINYLSRSIETNSPYVKFGSRSAKVVASGSDTTLVNSVAIGASPGTHTMSLYAYRGTSGSIGGTIDNTVARVSWEGTGQSTTSYEDVGGGWWRLTYSATPTASSTNEYGVWLADGETLYVDGFVLEEKASATTFTDGSLGTGYSWSGTVNESSSSRTVVDLDYAVTGTADDNIEAAAGSVSFWVRPMWDGDDGVEHVFLDTDTSAGTLKLYKTTGNVLTLTDGTNTATTSISGWSKGEWHHVVATWGSSDMNVYVDSSVGTAAGAFSAPTLGTSMYVGQSNTNGSLADATIADLRTYDAVLSSAEVTDLYHAGEVVAGEGPVMDAFSDDIGGEPVAYWHFDEGYGSTAHDSSALGNHLTISGASWGQQSLGGEGMLERYLAFDGTDDYLIQDPDDDFNFGTGSFSVGGWFRHPSSISATEYIVARHGSAGFKVYMDSSGHLCFGIDDDSTWTPTDTACTGATLGSLADSSWHHFMAVKDGTDSIAIYIDGREITTNSSTTADGSLDSHSSLYVGIDTDGTSNPFNGWLDELTVYPYAKTAEQIVGDLQGNRRAVLIGMANDDFLSEGLVGYWKMDETNWDGTTGEVIDHSGNANHGVSATNDSGTSSGSNTSTTLNDTAKSWTTDAFADHRVTITGGTGSGQTRTVSSNTATELTVSSAWSTTPDATSTYRITGTTTGGKFGSGGDFDGADDSVELPSVGPFNNFTYSTWVYDGGESGDESIIGHSTTNWNWLIADRTNNYFKGRTYNSTLTESSVDLTTANGSLQSNTWQQITVTMEQASTYRGTYRMFINGELKSTYNDVPLPSNPINRIGFGNNSNYSADNLDEVRIYNRALSPAEVRDLYNFAPGPVGYWNFDEGTGTGTNAIKDRSGNNNHGTTNGDFGEEDWVPGKFGSAVNFDGTNDYISVEHDAAIAPGGTELTIETWIYHTGTFGTDDRFISKTAGNEGYTLRIDDGNADNLEMYIGDGATYHFCALAHGMSQNTWHHLAGTYDGSEFELFVDGNSIGTCSDAFTPSWGTNGLIFSGTSSQAWSGNMDDVRIYNYTRTQQQIVEDMNAGHPAPGSPVGSATATWRFDEGYGTTANDAINDKDLTLSSASWTNAGKFGKAWNGTGAIWLSRSDDDDFDFTNSDDFTWSGWFKSDSASNPGATEYIINKAAASTQGYAVYANTSGQVCFGIDDDATWGPDVESCTTDDFYDGNWHLVTAVRNTTADETRIYIDGISRDSDTDTTTATLANSLTLYLGDRDGTDNGDEFNGDLDQVSLYPSALTADQAKTLFNQGFSQVFGATSTDSSDVASWSAGNEYCPPGEGSSCTPPVGEWKFDENTGTGTDVIKNTGTTTGSYDGDTNGSMTEADWIPGKSGSALDFDGNDDRINIGIFNESSGDSAMTFSSWIKPDFLTTESTRGVFDTGVFSLYFNTTQDDFTFVLRTSSGSVTLHTSGLTWNQNEWHHITALYDGSEMSIYWDGKFEESTSQTGTINDEPSNVDFIGYDRNSTTYWLGSIDQVRYYDYARTPAQIAWEYNRGGPVGWWRFDECSGTTANDASGRGNNGTITPNTGNSTGSCGGTAGDMWADGTSGKRNASLAFDGTDDEVIITDTSTLRFDSGSQDFSLFAWVKRDTSGATHYIVSKEDADNDGYRLQLDSGNTVTCSVDAVDITSTSTIADTNWHHVGCTIDRDGNGQVYIDGRADGTATAISSEVMATTADIHLGTRSYTSTSYFDGQIDDVRVYNYALTAEQVQEVMGAGVVRFGP